MNLEIKEISDKALEHRKTILRIINKIGKGHVGGAFSCIDILSSLYYGGIANISLENFQKRNRNKIILSKGHSCISQYVILEDIGLITKDDLYSMNSGGILGEHPDPRIPGIDFISGSLGHGLGVAVGISLSSKLDELDNSTFVILGDGECYEGSVWEAAILASHLKLTNLIAIVDRNNLCIHGNTEEINSLEPFSEKWRSFGWNVIEIDGHNISEIVSSLKKRHESMPTAIIANTVKGKGVSFMENQSSWHHGSIDNYILESSLKELGCVE
jgi:transketolase